MKIEDNIYMLEIPCEIMGMKDVINLTAVYDEDSVVLVDTGFPGQLARIHKALKKDGIPFSKLKSVILTHQDIDHVGNITAILNEMKSEKVEVFAHKEEEAYIDGEKKPLKFAALESNLEKLPEGAKMVYKGMKAGFESNRVNIDKTLADGEELPYAGGMVVIHTPGHTPGHISLYIKEKKLLIAGDILKVKNNMLTTSEKNINFNNELNRKSLKKLMKYDIQTVICYHGGVYKNNVNKRIAQLVNEMQ